jgi:hypothetical protein
MARRPLTLVAVVVVRWSKDLDVIFIIFLVIFYFLWASIIYLVFSGKKLKLESWSNWCCRLHDQMCHNNKYGGLECERRLPLSNRKFSEYHLSRNSAPHTSTRTAESLLPGCAASPAPRRPQRPPRVLRADASVAGGWSSTAPPPQTAAAKERLRGLSAYRSTSAIFFDTSDPQKVKSIIKQPQFRISHVYSVS